MTARTPGAYLSIWHPLAPLAAASECVSAADIADRFGVSRRQVYRWRENGIIERECDRLAGMLHMNPLEIWPEFVGPGGKMCAYVNCGRGFAPSDSRQRYCDVSCKRRAAGARRRSDPAFRERARVAAAVYYAEGAEYAKAAARRQYAENADHLKARRRNRYAWQTWGSDLCAAMAAIGWGSHELQSRRDAA